LKKDFCDNCGTECVNTTVRIAVAEHHHLSDGTYVGEDEYRPADLCPACRELIRAAVPNIFKTVMPHPPREEMAMMDSPVRAESDFQQDRMPR
jgi:hypothetical protein